MEKKILSFEEIKEKIDNKGYDTELSYPRESHYKNDYVFDEDKSVKWNREKVKEENALINQKVKDYYQDVNRLDTELYEDSISAVLDYLEIDNRKIAEILYSEAYSRSHSSGRYETINTLESLVDIQYEIFKELKIK